MKNVVKLIPVALGLLTLASCNNDDFFGSNNDIAGKLTLDVTTEGSDVTRAYASGTKELAFTWGKNDQIRVFDKNMQKYDNFIYNTSAKKFVINNDPQYVADADYGYAIFGEEGCISYNGWQQDGADGVLTALVKIEPTITYKQIYDADENPVYKAALPQWGTVTIVGEGDDKHLSTDLKYLTGYGYAVFKSLAAGEVQYVRARSLKYKSTADEGDKLDVRNLKMGDPITALTTACDVNLDQPLNGWFNARMELNEEATVDSLKAGKMQKLTEGPLAIYNTNNSYGEITVNLGTSFTGGIVYLPIIPAWYEVLSFEYSANGNDWYVLRTLAPKAGETIGAKVGRMTKIGTMEMTGTVNKTETLDAAKNFDFVTTKLAADVATYNNITFKLGNNNISTGSTEATYTLYIPQLTQDITVNFTKENTETGVVDLHANTLMIKDAAGADNSNYNVTFNFETGFADDSKQIELNTKAGVTLVGDFGKLPTNATTVDPANAVDAITATGVKMLTLGTTADAFAPSDAENKLQQVTVISGNVATPNVAAGHGGKAVVNVLVQSDGDVSVGQNIKKITALGAKSVTVTDATDVATNAETININAAGDKEVELTLAKGVKYINLNGGIIKSVALQSGNAYAFADNSKIKVTSKGNSAISCKPNITNVTFSYTSSFDGTADGGAQANGAFATETADLVKAKNYLNTDVNNCVPIYTAAQLAAVGTTAGNYALMTEITELKEWTSPSISAAVKLYGNGKTIAKIDAPLFNAISAAGVEMDGIKITNATVTSTEDEGTGILANSVASGKDVTVVNSSVAGSITARYYAGGLIGKVAGTATFGNGTVTGTNANKAAVTSNVAFTNSTTRLRESLDQGTFGQFIGQVAGTATINIDCSATGNFDKNALKFYLNVKADGTKVGEFVGNGTLVGYSPAAAAIIKYGTKLGTETAYTLTTFNASGTGEGTSRTVYIDQETPVTYTFKLGAATNDIDDEVDKSGVVISGNPNTATIYHNAYTEMK